MSKLCRLFGRTIPTITYRCRCGMYAHATGRKQIDLIIDHLIDHQTTCPDQYPHTNH